MCNYYEETMPLFTNEEEYLKYYLDESLPIFDKLNIIIKKGQPFQRQALLKNLLIYEKESFFKSLINFIIDDILTWDSETILLLPKSLYLLIINTDYILENELFNTIFKHIIISISSGSEKCRNEYTYYFNKIVEFYSVIDIKNNNKIKQNFFPYTIKDDIIELIVSLGIFGQTSSNRKLCCFLSSSLCRIMVKITLNRENNLNDVNIKKLYERISYLFWDGDKIIEAQMVRELLYIIPIFKNIMFNNEDIIQAIKSYINHDTDHIIQVMAIISLLKNIVYLNNENNIINILFDKVKEIIEDFDYESIYKNTILHILINEIYNNYLSINPSFIYQIFRLRIMNNYYNYYKLDIFFIKNFDKYYFLINYFLDNAQYLENKYYLDTENTKINLDNNNNEMQEYERLVEQIQSEINFEEYFIKIYNELFLIKDNKDETKNTEYNENNIIEKDNELLDNDKNNELFFEYYIKNKANKKNIIDNLMFNEFYFEENIDIIFNQKNWDTNNNNNLYNKEILKKILFLYLAKIISCFENIKSNKTLGDKLISLFDKTNIIFALNIYSSSMKYLEENNKNMNVHKNLLKKHPLYKLFLFLLKKNIKYFLQFDKIKESKEIVLYEGNVYNKIIISILTNINMIYQESPKLINNDILVLIGKILNIILPKIYKYCKNIVYNAIIDNNESSNSGNMNSSYINTKETIKVCYFEKIYEEIFNNLISKIIINNNCGHHIIKEYIEVIPYYILYSQNRWKYYEFLLKEIISSDSFYKRKYSIIFFEKCFKIFSFGFICKNDLLNDFIILLKDKVNLISTNAIKLIYTYNKKIISFSIKKFQELCTILNEIYELNIKAFNDNENKNREIFFDKEKSIIINKIISINNNINLFYSEEEINKEKDKENILISEENEIIKFSKSINNNKSKKNVNINSIYYMTKSSINNDPEHNKINTNILQISASNFQGNKNNNIITNTGNKFSTPLINNKNTLYFFNSSQKDKNHKFSPWIEKSSSGLFKDKKPKTNIILNNFNKENKYLNNDIHHNNHHHNSTAKNASYNKHYLPKLKDLKINRKDLNFINNNIRSIDITFNKIHTKIDDNEEKIYNNINNNNFININNSTNFKIKKNDLRLISFTQNRIPSAKIKLMNSYQMMEGNENIKYNENPLYIKNYDNEKKISSNNNSNLKYNYFFNNNIKETNNIRSISNKHINLELGQHLKHNRLKKDNNVSYNAIHKIYIDAGK